MRDVAFFHITSSAPFDYFLSSAAWVAVLIPAVLSLGILAWYMQARRISTRLQLLWSASILITLSCARWDYSNDLHQLYLYSAFSVACLVLLLKRMYIPPALVYALTFFSLCLVDLGEALAHAIQWHLPLASFYYGVGGAGIFDALFIIPAMTALAVACVVSRLKRENGLLREF